MDSQDSTAKQGSMASRVSVDRLEDSSILRNKVRVTDSKDTDNRDTDSRDTDSKVLAVRAVLEGTAAIMVMAMVITIMAASIDGETQTQTTSK